LSYNYLYPHPFLQVIFGDFVSNYFTMKGGDIVDPFDDIEGVDAYGFSDFFNDDPEVDQDADQFDNELFYEPIPGEELNEDD